MTFAEYLVAWAQLHGTQSPKGLVRVWLRIAFFLSTPLTKFNPNLITAFGTLLMGAAIYFASESISKGKGFVVLLKFVTTLFDDIDFNTLILCV